MPLRSCESDEVLVYNKTFEVKAVVYFSSIMSLYVCSLHTKNYV